MNIILYSGFYKRRNSTKQPSGGTAFTVALKENTSMMRPHFLIHTVDWSWNYAQWGPRYYYVTDIVSESNNLFRVECELDVLATFRADIGAYSTLISRASADQNYDVIDSIYPAKARPITKRTQIANDGIFTTNKENGTYLLGALGASGLNFYAMSASEFDLFCYRLFPSLNIGLDQWATLKLAEAPAGGINSIMQSIVLLKWLPVNWSSISSLLSSVGSIDIGNFHLVTGASKISAETSYRILSKSITFGDRDDAGARGRWLYVSPFASYSVYIPPFGNIAVDGTYLISGGMQLSADIMVELTSGNVTLRLYYSIGQSGPKMLGVYNANVSTDLKAGGVDASASGVIGGVAGAIASIYDKDYAGAAASISSAAKSAMPQSYQTGGGVSGPVADLGQNWYSYATYFDPIDEDQAELGRPLAEIKQISTLGGFVQTASAKLAIPGHAEEMVEVNNMLNSGIFYE